MKNLFRWLGTACAAAVKSQPALKIWKTNEMKTGSGFGNNSRQGLGRRTYPCEPVKRSARCVAGAIAAVFLYGLGAQAGVSIVDLGLGTGRSPLAMNNSGQVIGVDITPWNGSSQSFQSWIWQNGAITDLGAPQPRANFFVSINNSGQVVGTLNYDDAFLWQNGVLTDLGPVVGGTSTATGINDSGQVIGNSDDGLFCNGYIW